MKARKTKKVRHLESRPPLVWMFQPTTFEVVTGDRLKKWERDMTEHLGLGKKNGSPKKSRVHVHIKVAPSGTCSYSHSGPHDSAPDDGDAD